MGTRSTATVVCFAASVLVACSSHEDPVDPALTSVATPKSALAHSNFRDCAEFREYYARALSREYLEGAWFGVPCWGCEFAMLAAGAPSTAEGAFQDSVAGAAPAPVAVSQTNTQEAGVDEEDVIEADPDTGRFYLLRGYVNNELLAVNAVPAEAMTITSRRPTGEHYASGLYLDPDANRLVVVTNLYGWLFWDGLRRHFASGSTQLLFYDLTDPDQPQLTDRYEISGYLLGTRRIGQRLHLVTSSPAGLPGALAQDSSFFDLVYRDYYGARQRGDRMAAELFAAQIRARINQAVRNAPLAELLPVWRQGLDEVSAPVPLACPNVSHPQVDERLGLIAISSINTDGSGLAQMGAINNAWQMYSSPQHLYLTQTSGGWWWDRAQTQQTAIYRYRIGDSGPAHPAGHGVVDGWLHGSYGLSEHGGNLRTATSEARFVPDEGWRRTNHLFVLGATGGGPLEVVGQVRDFEPGETIFAARFLGDRGFVVTFRIIDPLITFDLSNPTAPSLAGSLEVPGVATYLHPYGGQHLLTIGRGTSPAGFWTGQVQLQLFDVADLDSPQLLAKALIGEQGQWAWSVAQHEPHAFTQFGDLLSVPARIAAENFEEAFSGFVAYRVAVPGGFSELGRIDHKQPDDGSGGGCPTTTDGSDAPCLSFAPVLFNFPLRSVLLTEDSGRTVLYTLSNAYLRAHAVGDSLEEITTLPLRPE